MSEPRSENVPPTQSETFYEDERVIIHRGDCARVMDDIFAGSATMPAFDLAFADPPYNFGIEYDGYSDDLDPAAYAAWCGEWWATLRSLAKAVIVTPGHGNLPLWFDIAKPSGIGCWYKPGGTGSSFLGWCEWEPWLYWGPRLGGGDTIRATLNPTFKSDVGHPCPKPVELLKGLMLKTKAQSVIDPFMGSGTTLVAAKALGIRAVGIEQSARYCAVAADRLRQGTLDFSSSEGVDPTTAATAAPPSDDEPPPWCSWRRTGDSRPNLACSLTEGHTGPHAEYVTERGSSPMLALSQEVQIGSNQQVQS